MPSHRRKRSSRLSLNSSTRLHFACASVRATFWSGGIESISDLIWRTINAMESTSRSFLARLSLCTSMQQFFPNMSAKALALSSADIASFSIAHYCSSVTRGWVASIPNIDRNDSEMPSSAKVVKFSELVSLLLSPIRSGIASELLLSLFESIELWTSRMHWICSHLLLNSK